MNPNPVTIIVCAGIVAATLMALAFTARRDLSFRPALLRDDEQTGLEYMIILVGLILPSVPTTLAAADTDTFSRILNGLAVIACEILCFGIWALIVGRGASGGPGRNPCTAGKRDA